MTVERDRVVRSRTMHEVARELDALADDRAGAGDHTFSEQGRVAIRVAAAFVEKWARDPKPLPERSDEGPKQPDACPECGLNPIADGYSVCEVCAYRPRRSGEEKPRCPRLADVLAGRDPGPHDDSTCGWCARLRLGCSCGTPGTGNFEGPQRDCSIHGEEKP